MSSAPLISVIVPVFNGEKYLSAAIESILIQDYRPLQIIVVDDGSTDGTAEIAQRFEEVEYRWQNHAGVATALNTGISMARGKLIAFLDADDLWVEGKLRKQVAALDADRELSIVFGNVEQFRETVRDGVPPILGVYPGHCKSAMLLRRAVLAQVGEFNTACQRTDFIDWFARAKEQGLDMFVVPDVIAKRRIHDTNMGIRLRDQKAEYAQALKWALDRRRAAQNLASAASTLS